MLSSYPTFTLSRLPSLEYPVVFGSLPLIRSRLPLDEASVFQSQLLPGLASALWNTLWSLVDCHLIRSTLPLEYLPSFAELTLVWAKLPLEDPAVFQSQPRIQSRLPLEDSVVLRDQPLILSSLLLQDPVVYSKPPPTLAWARLP
jgi:hypothetical protein